MGDLVRPVLKVPTNNGNAFLALCIDALADLRQDPLIGPVQLLPFFKVDAGEAEGPMALGLRRPYDGPAFDNLVLADGGTFESNLFPCEYGNASAGSSPWPHRGRRPHRSPPISPCPRGGLGELGREDPCFLRE